MTLIMLMALKQYQFLDLQPTGKHLAKISHHFFHFRFMLPIHYMKMSLNHFMKLFSPKKSVLLQLLQGIGSDSLKQLWRPEGRQLSDMQKLIFIIVNSILLNLLSCLPLVFPVFQS